MPARICEDGSLVIDTEDILPELTSMNAEKVALAMLLMIKREANAYPDFRALLFFCWRAWNLDTRMAPRQHGHLNPADQATLIHSAIVLVLAVREMLG